jgi:NitT/TauT family transport system substrate-binding protein
VRAMGWMGRRRAPRGAVVAAVVPLVLATAGCGLVGDDGAEVPPQVRGLRQPSELDEGCGEQADTDPTDVAADRTVARCSPDAPAPQPLPRPATLRVGIRAATEDLAPVLLADRLGAFEEDNLTVDLVEMDDPVELFEALERGQVDAVAGDFDAPFFDIVHAGSGARAVLGGAVAPEAGNLAAAQPGLWIRSDAVTGAERWRDLHGQRVVVEDGIRDVAAYPMDALLRQDDTTLDDLELVRESGAAAAEALLAGDDGVVGAWLTEPHWRQVAGRADVRLVATLPAESLGGVVLGERFVGEGPDRAVGVAFVRAVIRTINTHLTGDYQEDGDVVAALAEATGQSREVIRATPAWVFDWELRRDTTGRIQRPLIEAGGVTYEDEIPESDLVDRSLYQAAVNAED